MIYLFYWVLSGRFDLELIVLDYWFRSGVWFVVFE